MQLLETNANRNLISRPYASIRKLSQLIWVNNCIVKYKYTTSFEEYDTYKYMVYNNK